MFENRHRVVRRNLAYSSSHQDDYYFSPQIDTADLTRVAWSSSLHTGLFRERLTHTLVITDTIRVSVRGVHPSSSAALAGKTAPKHRLTSHRYFRHLNRMWKMSHAPDKPAQENLSFGEKQGWRGETACALRMDSEGGRAQGSGLETRSTSVQRRTESGRRPWRRPSAWWCGLTDESQVPESTAVTSTRRQYVCCQAFPKPTDPPHSLRMFPDWVFLGWRACKMVKYTHQAHDVKKGEIPTILFF